MFTSAPGPRCVMCAFATRAQRARCERAVINRERSTVRLFRGAVSDDAVSGLAARAAEHGVRSVHDRRAPSRRAEPARSRHGSDAAARRALRTDVTAGSRGSSRPVRHVSVGRITILLESDLDACVKALCQLSLPGESLTVLSLQPATLRRAASHGESRGSTVGRRRASDFAAPNFAAPDFAAVTSSSIREPARASTRAGVRSAVAFYAEVIRRAGRSDQHGGS